MNKLKNEKVKAFISLRDDWCSDIPKEIISGTNHSKENYKVRGAWFQMVISSVENALYRFPELKRSEDEINFIIDEFTTGEFTHRLTTKEDIEKMDMILNKVIKVLQNLNTAKL